MLAEKVRPWPHIQAQALCKNISAGADNLSGGAGCGWKVWWALEESPTKQKKTQHILCISVFWDCNLDTRVWKRLRFVIIKWELGLMPRGGVCTSSARVCQLSMAGLGLTECQCGMHRPTASSSDIACIFCWRSVDLHEDVMCTYART